MALNLGAIADYLNSKRAPVEGDGLNMAMMQRQLMKPQTKGPVPSGYMSAPDGIAPMASPGWIQSANDPAMRPPMPPVKGPTYTAIKRQDAVTPDPNFTGYGRTGPFTQIPSPSPTPVPNAGYFGARAPLPRNPGPPDPTPSPSGVDPGPVEPEPIIGGENPPSTGTVPWWTGPGYEWLPTEGLPITGYSYGPEGDTHTLVPTYRGTGTHPELGLVNGIPVGFGNGIVTHDTSGAAGGGITGGAGQTYSEGPSGFAGLFGQPVGQAAPSAGQLSLMFPYAKAI
jgi:hypothetical protein